MTLDDMHFEIGDAEAALEALARHAGDCIKLIDLDGRVIRWNAACEELYGWPADAVVGETLPHIPAEMRLRVLSDIRRVSASGRIAEREGEAQRFDGTRIMMRMTLIPVRDEDGHVSGLLTTSRELAGDRRLERQRDEFLAFVSRRLRDPLAAVLGSAQLLSRPEILGDTERRESTVAAITRRAQEASSLLEDLLVVSELVEGRLVLAPTPVDLGDLVTEIVAESGVLEEGYVEFDPMMGPVPVDRRRFAQAVAALMENAVHRASGQDAVSVSIFVSGDDAVVEVTDDGESPSLDDLDSLLDRFGTTIGDGAPPLSDAIGLYLARYVAEAHGGGLNLGPRKDGGAVFSLFVPLRYSDSEGTDPS